MTPNPTDYGWRGHLRVIVCRIFRNPFVERDIVQLQETALGLQASISTIMQEVAGLQKLTMSAEGNTEVALLRKKLSALQTRVDALGDNVAFARAEMAGADAKALKSATTAKNISGRSFVTHDVLKPAMDSLIQLMNDSQMVSFQRENELIVRIAELEAKGSNIPQFLTQDVLKPAIDSLIQLMNDNQMASLQRETELMNRIAQLEVLQTSKGA